MRVEKEGYGDHNGQRISSFLLDNGNGVWLRILDFGGIVTELYAPGRSGGEDIVLGLSSLQDYIADKQFMGALIGRCANRIGGAQFSIAEETYMLNANEPPNHLHGGEQGIHKQFFFSELYTDSNDCCLRLYRRSPHLEGGYPGNLDISIEYRLTPDNKLQLRFEATTDRPTPVSISHHNYFNLKGHAHGSIAELILQVAADHYTPTDDQLLPTGDRSSVTESRYDFLTPKPLKNAITENPGLDINYLIAGTESQLNQAALLHDPDSWRTLRIETTLPGIQIYDGAKLDIGPSTAKMRCNYGANAGLCLEPQMLPNAINQPTFPSPLLQPDQKYNQIIHYTFSVEEQPSPLAV